MKWSRLGRSDKGSYRCPSCSKRFTRRDHLRTHEKNIHGEDAGPFACVICAQLYKNSESLRKHVAKFHMFRVHEKNESCLKRDVDSNFERILWTILGLVVLLFLSRNRYFLSLEFLIVYFYC